MADLGFDYRFSVPWQIPEGAEPPASPEQFGTPEYEALWGNPFADDYDPTSNAGCYAQVRSTLGTSN